MSDKLELHQTTTLTDEQFRQMSAILVMDRIGMKPAFNGYGEAFGLALDGWPAWRIAERMGCVASFVQMLKDGQR